MGISCLKASELSSKKLDEGLSLREKCALFFHSLLCMFCDQFTRHVEFMSRLFKKEDLLANAGACMRPEAREKLKQSVKEKIVISKE